MIVRRARAAVAAVLVVVLAAVVGAGLTATPALAGSQSPQATLSTTVAPVGQLVHITGTGWSPVGSIVEILICGDDALTLSGDCDQTDSYQAAIRAGGIFYAGLRVRLPPVPCPCVVWITATQGVGGVKLPIQIPGAPVAPLHGFATPTVKVKSHLVTHSSVAVWFGAPEHVTLVVVVDNSSASSYTNPTISVTVGHGRDPTGFAAGRSLSPLDNGASRTVRIPVTIPAVTYGRYTVRAVVATGVQDVVTSDTTTTYPWGLLVVPVVLIVLLAWFFVLVWRWWTERKHGPPSWPTDTPPTGVPQI